MAVDRPAVCHTVWLAPDGRRLILLLNESREEAEVRLDLPRGVWRLERMGQAESEDIGRGEAASVRVPALGVCALVSAVT